MNNIRNKLIQAINIEKIITRVTGKEIKVKKIENFQHAFVHKSFLIKESYNSDDDDNYCAFYYEPRSSNERLEFLGDSILNFTTAEYVYQLFPNSDEGFLTKLRTKLVRNTQLSYIGSELGFKEFLLISSSVEQMNGRENPRLIEDVFESFIASLYKDQGFYITREFIFGCFDLFVDVNELVSNNDNYKDTLLRFFQLNVWSHPVYETIITSGTGPSKMFTTTVLLNKEICDKSIDIELIINIDSSMQDLYKINFSNDYMIGVGVGKTKKESQQNASKTCLEVLNVPKDF